MEENTNIFVVDTSYILSFLMPDEQSDEARKLFERYGQKEIVLISTTLLEYEVANALSANVLRKRITPEEAGGLLNRFTLLKIPTFSVVMHDMLELSLKLNISCYDASYVALAREKKAELLTYDERLLRS